MPAPHPPLRLAHPSGIRQHLPSTLRPVNERSIAMNAVNRSIRIGATYTGQPTPGAIADFVQRTVVRVREHFAAARQGREAEAHLLGMNDRDLRDIGLTRHELHRLFNDGWI
jgi:uncharacterized protein YjiS (DUF1127 family)